jgi:tetratricopeptide (TPR) repeat protein
LLTVTLQSLVESNGVKSGTLLYMAPEVISGGPPTVAADMYALGILLYQMVVGDLNRPLTAGWEKDVSDPVLREDIAAAADGTAALRLAAAATLADRLQTLTERRARRNENERRAAEAAAIADRLRRSQIRRPWVLLAAGILVLGSIAIGAFALRVAQERDEARRQAGIAEAVKLFLTDDVLGRGNPASSGKANETLMEAATKAEPRIAFRLESEPAVAAAIYLSLAEAFDSRSAYAEARAAYGQAISAFEKGQGPNAADATIARLKQARMEIMAGDAGSQPRARALIAAADSSIASLGERADEARVWLLMARGTLEMTGGSVQQAQQDFQQASDRADAMPHVFDLGTRLILRQAQASALFRLGQWDRADAILNELLKQQLALHGPAHPDTLLVRLGLAQVAMGRGDAKSAVAAINLLYPDMVPVFGADHRMVLQALSIRARASGLLTDYPTAIRDDREVYRATVAKQGEQSQFAIYPLNDIAESECRDNDFGNGLRDAEKAYALAQHAFPTVPAIPQAVSAQVAFCLIIGKQYAQAKAILDGIDRKAVADLIGDPDVGAGIDLMLAAIALASGDKVAATKLLQAPSQAFTRPNTDPYTRSWTNRLLQDARP